MTMYEQAKAEGTIHICSNGVEVWPVKTPRFGRLWTCGDAKIAWLTKEEAIRKAEGK